MKQEIPNPDLAEPPPPGHDRYPTPTVRGIIFSLGGIEKAKGEAWCIPRPYICGHEAALSCLMWKIAEGLFNHVCLSLSAPSRAQKCRGTDT